MSLEAVTPHDSLILQATLLESAATSALPATGAALRPRDLSIDYLRCTLTLMVVAHHSMLAYTTWASFDTEHVFRSTAPVVDAARWVVLDYAENFNDVFFMSLMFFISGLFVFPAVRRHGVLGFARDRLLRLGLPFAVAVCLLMPVAFYPSWLLGAHSHGFWDFYAHIARAGFLVGPPWFLWVLLLFDLLLALALIPPTQWLQATTRFTRQLEHHSGLAFLALLVLSACAYLPLLARYGFSSWAVLWTSPFAFQQARIALYALWFLAGVLIGAPGIATGWLSQSGSLARHWRSWLASCALAYAALTVLPRLLVHSGVAVPLRQRVEAMLWVVSCVCSCFGFLALFRGVGMAPSRLMDSLSRSAYVIYLVHYVFITWSQLLLRDSTLPAGVKATLVFLITLGLSWLSAQLFLRLPGVKQIV